MNRKDIFWTTATLMFVILICLMVYNAPAQDKKAKADTTATLDIRKVQTAFNALEKDLQHANDQILYWTTVRDKTLGKLEAVQELANNPAFRLKTDSTLTKRERK
jgi:peptidoglycan hydrolase CwlO-like protein